MKVVQIFNIKLNGVPANLPDEFNYVLYDWEDMNEARINDMQALISERTGRDHCEFEWKIDNPPPELAKELEEIQKSLEGVDNLPDLFSQIFAREYGL